MNYNIIEPNKTSPLNKQNCYLKSSPYDVTIDNPYPTDFSQSQYPKTFVPHGVDREYSPYNTIDSVTFNNNKLNLCPLPEQDVERMGKGQFLFLNDHPKNYFAKGKALVDSHEENYLALKQVFFSPENIEIIQKMLIMLVYKKTNKEIVIAMQSRERLTIVMAWIFDNYSKNLPYKIKEQIEELNRITINEILPDLLSNIDQYIGYIRDINNPIRSFDRPLNVSSKGTKTLPSTMRRISEDKLNDRIFLPKI